MPLRGEGLWRLDLGTALELGPGPGLGVHAIAGQPRTTSGQCRDGPSAAPSQTCDRLVDQLAACSCSRIERRSLMTCRLRQHLEQPRPAPRNRGQRKFPDTGITTDGPPPVPLDQCLGVDEAPVHGLIGGDWWFLRHRRTVPGHQRVRRSRAHRRWRPRSGPARTTSVARAARPSEKGPVHPRTQKAT